MNNTLTVFKTFLFLAFLFNINTLSAQADDIEVFCPLDVCGSDDDFGATDGIYTDSGMTENGQVIYTGPLGNESYHIKCVSSFPVDEMGNPAPFPVFRWEVHALDGTLIYFDSNVQPFTPFAFDMINDDWNWDNSDFDPQPTMIAPLPVELSYFKAKQGDKTVQLHWETTTEINNEGFEVQHSTDNRNWQELEFIVGEGTTYETQTYEYTDKEPQSGKNYYRLKQIDFDGRFVYSSIIVEEVAFGSLKIYPNPVNGQSINLQFPASDYEDASIEIYDNLGRKMTQSILSYGDSQVDISDLTPGFYIVSVKVGGQFYQERLIKK